MKMLLLKKTSIRKKDNSILFENNKYFEFNSYKIESKYLWGYIVTVENIKNILREEYTCIFIANDYGAGVHLFEISKLVSVNKFFVFLGPSKSLLSTRDLNYEDLDILDNLPNHLKYKIFLETYH